MEIVKATVNDIDQLIELRLQYLKLDRGGLSIEEETLIKNQLWTYFLKHLATGDFLAIFAKIDNKIVSTAYLAIAEKPADPDLITGITAMLMNVMTLPEHRRKGIGTKVISRIILEAKKMNVSVIEVLATPDGKLLYETLRFNEIKTRHTGMKLQLVKFGGEER